MKPPGIRSQLPSTTWAILMYSEYLGEINLVVGIDAASGHDDAHIRASYRFLRAFC